MPEGPGHPEGHWGGPPWTRGSHGGPFRPPWWPDDEPFPPRGGWPGSGRRFIRRMALRFVAFLALVVGLSALIVAVVFRAVHFSGRPGAVLVVTVLTFFWLAWLTAIGARLLRRTAAPIADMMDAARHVERGDYAPRVQVRG